MGAPPIGPPDVSSLLNDSPTGCLRVSDHCRRNRAVRIFISYAAEQRSIAESLAVSLRQAGHEVYSDRDTLPDSDAHLARIRDEISRCDLFVFLVSDASLEESSYARMELDLARSRWPEPSVHVLPVIVQHPSVEMPDYLSVATLIEPAGNLVADTPPHPRSARARRRARSVRLAASLGADHLRSAARVPESQRHRSRRGSSSVGRSHAGFWRGHSISRRNDRRSQPPPFARARNTKSR
jgi:hypothetical protein